MAALGGALEERDRDPSPGLSAVRRDPPEFCELTPRLAEGGGGGQGGCDVGPRRVAVGALKAKAGDRETRPAGGRHDVPEEGASGTGPGR